MKRWGADVGGAKRVLALVPANNEEATVGTVVTELRGLEAVDEVVVVSDGSRDGTIEAAHRAGARVLATRRRVGKGGGLEAALNALGSADVYLLIDGDVGETAREAEALLAPVLSGKLDLAVGKLPRQAGGGFGAVKGATRRAIRLVARWDCEEPLSGQRAITRESLDGCRPLARGFGLEAAMIVDALRLGFRVGEVSVAMRHRPTRRDLTGFLHRGRQGLDVLVAMLPRALGIR